MSKIERFRENVTSLTSEDERRAREAEGWRPVAIEWEREVEGTSAAATKHEVPYGLRVSEDCHFLEEDAGEAKAMALILALVVDDNPLSKVAEELNQRGYRMRSGASWTQIGVFKLLPRIIEYAPRVLSSEEWAKSRDRILRAV